VLKRNAKAESASNAIPNSLSSAELSRVVRSYAPSVQQTCWQSNRDLRAPDAPTTARVSVTIRIRPSGDVTSVTSNGEAVGYSDLASCIKNQVRTWKFPPASGSSVFKIPFIFTGN
jgi:hypothetical protein